MTEVDSLHMVLLEFGDTGVYERAEHDLGRTLTLHEVIELEFATVRTPLDEVTAWLVENVRVRPGFRELVERFHPLVVSSGFHELIEPVLAREGVRGGAAREPARPAARRLARAVARRVRLPGVRRAVQARLCRRTARSSTSATATRTAASRWRPTRVFARDGLAEYLDEQGVSYERFETLSDVVAALRRQ